MPQPRRRANVRRAPQRNPPDRLTPLRGSPFSSAPPSPPAPQAMPFDASYDSQMGQNTNVLNLDLAGIEYGRGQVAYNYGFDAAGNLDPTNPFSKAKEFERQYHQAQSGTTNSMAARGQLYSGALQRTLDEGTHRYGVGLDALRQGATGEYNAYTQAEARARADYGQANIDAGSDRADRWADYRPQDPGPAVTSQERDPLTPAQRRRYRRGKVRRP